VDGSGSFMDYDGVTEPGGPGITTRGMQGLARRWYLDVYPALDGPALGAAR
jgi:hypothetical protein